MSGHDRADGRRTQTRRQWLAVLGVGVASGLAGCGSDDSSDEDDDEEDDSEDTENDPEPANDTPADAIGGEDGTGDSASGCPTGSFSYVSQQYSAMGQTGYLGQCEIPESARIENASDGIGGNGFTAIFEWGNGELTSFGIGAQFSKDPAQDSLEDPTVEDEVEGQIERNQADLSRATDQFEDVPDGGVVLVSEGTVDGDPSIPLVTIVVLDHPDGVLSVSVSLNQNIGCPDASERIHRRLIESQRPA